MNSPSPPAKAIQLTVSPAQAGKRLDVFLTSGLPDFSRSQVQNLIEKGCVESISEGKALKSSQPVLEGQVFKVSIPPVEKTGIPAQPLDLDIAFEDEDVLVINKPVGLVVHPGAGNPDGTLMNALVAHCPDIAGVGGVLRPGLVHRLDKDTSGLLAVAKSDLAYRSLVRQLKNRFLSRLYLSLVTGCLTGEGTVDAPISRHVTDRKRMAVRAEVGKPAVTRFISIQANEKTSLLLLKLETGRTHQIRAHMAFIKHPVLGDAVYGGACDSAGRQMLHAFRLSFQHPKTGKTKTFCAKPPQDFMECLEKSGFKVPSWSRLDWKKKEKKSLEEKDAT
jgi:23S rRNA pseudouridine1911/1915/1917 synthase